MNILKKEKGFTIIEVVLVLAIAGLIFLMVFIALPALQSSQRDTARKNDVGTVGAAVNSYMSNNRGTFPTTASIESYVTGVSANTTSVSVGTAGTTSIAPEDGVVQIIQRTRCSDSTDTSQALVAGTTRQYTVTTKLEAGNGAYYCQDS